MAGKSKIIIIGGGASGLIAAISAKRSGADVIILEKEQRVGKKILATGNGRCNFTNQSVTVSDYHGKNPDFTLQALSAFGVEKTIKFFEDLGILNRIEECGKIFPYSLQASSVLDVLRYEIERLGVEVVTEIAIKIIKKSKSGFFLQSDSGKTFNADKVIIACGGKAYPSLGSNGSGYSLALQLGHSIVEPFPAMVPLKLNFKFLKQIKGIKLEGKASVIDGEKVMAEASGEILFTEYGISGPPILSISRKASEMAQKRKSPVLKVDMLPEFDEETLRSIIKKRIKDGSSKTISFNFVGFLNKQLAPVVIKSAGIEDINRLSGTITDAEIDNIIKILKNWRFEITGNTSWPNAQVTAGGVDVRDVSPETLESKVTPGIYFCGEVLDIDGSCGGYNLQWAWSSGYVAGKSAAKI